MVASGAMQWQTVNSWLLTVGWLQGRTLSWLPIIQASPCWTMSAQFWHRRQPCRRATNGSARSIATGSRVGPHPICCPDGNIAVPVTFPIYFRGPAGRRASHSVALQVPACWRLLCRGNRLRDNREMARRSASRLPRICALFTFRGCCRACPSVALSWAPYISAIYEARKWKTLERLILPLAKDGSRSICCSALPSSKSRPWKCPSEGEVESVTFG